MRTSRFSLAILCLALFCASWQATDTRAQTVISGTTVNNSGADYFVGVSNSLQTLTINSGGRLINADRVVIGQNEGANNNLITVTGPNSVMWANTDILIGEVGSYNGLVISAGGNVSGKLSDIGFGISYEPTNDVIGADHNYVVVTGAGSTWSNATYLLVGDWGPNNSLTVSNGGYVYVGLDSFVGGQNVYFDTGTGKGDNNSALVTGSNSTWETLGALQVGFRRSGNVVTVNNGGVLLSGSANLGYEATASNNVIGLAGPGTMWVNNTTLVIGADGYGNSVVVSNGAVVVTASTVLGHVGNDNQLVIADAGSVWSNAGPITIGSSGSGNSVRVQNQAHLLTGDGILGAGSGASNNTVQLGNALWQVHGNLVVGAEGSLNRVQLSNGSFLETANATVGQSAQALNNQISVSGSVWSNQGILVVGQAGSGNQVSLSGGSELFSAGALIGQGASAANNRIDLNGSSWVNAGDLYVGDLGAGNQFNLANASAAVAGDLVVGNVGAGNQFSAANGSVAVGGVLVVGQSGAGNQVSVANGSVTVAREVVVGATGENNRLSLNGGGSVDAADIYIGASAGANGNVVSLNGGGALLSAVGELVVGHGGSGNSVQVGGGATLSASNSYLGVENGTGNSASVNGGNAKWLTRDSLMIGLYANGNTLTVAGGGLVAADASLVGVGSSLNSVSVSGSGSVFSNATTLVVGYGGNDNVLEINNGAAVLAQSSALGYDGDNNRATVTGNGSWRSSAGLVVGEGGAGNSLAISNGGVVQAAEVLIGSDAGYSGNRILVGSGGRLVATNGGAGLLEVRHGSLNLSGGTVATDLLLATNNSATISFATGTISASAMQIQTGTGFQVGNGSGAATLFLGQGSFADGLVIGNGGLLTGVGGNIIVNGAYAQQAGGALQLALVNTNDFEQLNVSQQANLGGTLRVVQNGNWKPAGGDTVVLITAGERTNEFAAFVNNTGLWAKLLYDETSVSIQWTNILLSAYGQNANQVTVGRAIDEALPDVRLAEAMGVLNDLVINHPEQIPAALDSIAPEELSAMYRVPLATMDAFGSQFRGRVNSLRAGSRGFDATRIRLIDWEDGGNVLPPPSAPLNQPVLYSWEPGFDPLSPSRNNPWGFYIDGAGSFLSIDDKPEAKGYNLVGSAMTLGADRWVNANLVLGATLGYVGDEVDLTDGGKLTTDGVRGSIYAVYISRGWHLEGMLAGAYHSMESKRSVLGGSADGQTDGTSFSAQLSGGYDWHLQRWSIGPEALVQFSFVNVDGFTEKGSPAPLEIEQDSFDALHTQLGLRTSYHATWFETAVVVPFLSVGWRHDFTDQTVPITASFASGAGAPFKVESSEAGTDSVALNVGVSVQWNEQFNTYLGYSTEIGRDGYQQHNANGGFRFNF